MGRTVVLIQICLTEICFSLVSETKLGSRDLCWNDLDTQMVSIGPGLVSSDVTSLRVQMCYKCLISHLFS